MRRLKNKIFMPVILAAKRYFTLHNGYGHIMNYLRGTQASDADFRVRKPCIQQRIALAPRMLPTEI